MTAKSFEEVMHNIACSEESEKYYREIRNAKKRKNRGGTTRDSYKYVWLKNQDTP